jgi:hypothetical protein
MRLKHLTFSKSCFWGLFSDASSFEILDFAGFTWQYSRSVNRFLGFHSAYKCGRELSTDSEHCHPQLNAHLALNLVSIPSFLPQILDGHAWRSHAVKPRKNSA